MKPESSDITKNYFFKGKVIVYQRRKGYRFSVDAPILADFLPCLATQKALEVGIGVGIVSLLALYKKKFSYIYGIEIQSSLSELAELNIEKNDFLDMVFTISDEEAIDTTRKLSQEEGLLVGTSSGANVFAALHMDNGRNKVVTVLPDRAERYFSTALL